MSKVCPTASAICNVDPGIKDEVCTPASSAQPEEKLLDLVRVPRQGIHNAACSDRVLAIDDIRSPAHIPSYEDFLRAIFEANWHAVAQVAWHVGQTSYVPGIYRSGSHSEMVVAAMKEALIRDVWRRSWVQCELGACAVHAVSRNLGFHIPDGFFVDIIDALKHAMLELVSEEDWALLDEPGRLACDLAAQHCRSMSDDYGEVMGSMATGVVQSLYKWDWEGAVRKSIRMKAISDCWHVPLAGRCDAIVSALKRLLTELGSRHSWGVFIEACGRTISIIRSLHIIFPASVSNTVLGLCKAHLMQLAMHEAWIQLDCRASAVEQVACSLRRKLPHEYHDVIFLAIEKAVANFSRGRWFAAYTAATVANQLAKRWTKRSPRNHDMLFAGMQQTLVYLVSNASWRSAEQGVLCAQFIAAASGEELTGDFYGAVMAAWKHAFLRVLAATNWQCATHAARCAIAISLSFRRELPQDIRDEMVGAMRMLCVEWAKQGQLAFIGQTVELMIAELHPLMGPVQEDFFADILVTIEGPTWGLLSQSSS